MHKNLLFLVCFVLLAAACGSGAIENPTSKEILENNPDADIFVYDGIVFSNASDLPYYQLDHSEKGNVLGEIKETTDKSKRFKDFTSTVLPIGTPLYSTTEEQTDSHFTIIATVDEVDILYIALLEG
ncbi:MULTISPECIES: hypothetical protein [Bacillaceae]|uniref:Uncharacterized protein n=1 Tax=Evansella alkalicola TaxID=745819 RepID=A0ABS6JS32_9BACI|nr:MULTISPECIES: hypothetical protein [Bacillaceae]MBU9721378.1 hypothetical protein [Bacillus alkalicola]